MGTVGSRRCHMKRLQPKEIIVKKAILPRLFVALTAAVISLALLDTVARMGQPEDGDAVVTAMVRPASDRAAAFFS